MPPTPTTRTPPSRPQRVVGRPDQRLARARSARDEDHERAGDRGRHSEPDGRIPGHRVDRVHEQRAQRRLVDLTSHRMGADGEEVQLIAVVAVAGAGHRQHRAEDHREHVERTPREGVSARGTHTRCLDAGPLPAQPPQRRRPGGLVRPGTVTVQASSWASLQWPKVSESVAASSPWSRAESCAISSAVRAKSNTARLSCSR